MNYSSSNVQLKRSPSLICGPTPAAPILSAYRAKEDLNWLKLSWE
ncbi:conserved hypothetical protein [Sclerotinia sclerotiorum 1980 UF-70]|uniref:Uncharacterized protein n=1 Tax=Sclerotinia sclerotiorum (strain ATCC 18683 / 1980 / Ss-1) TaxID=665079 RepID=A7ESL3_SCLS1|nr:conserved hypothetical protein [Sclerotinia sclerotiorum 1980 UF-70]EDN92455.1 conserved hypothetical protein [Sclerotinia sclerotiorum 1980 UF-70]